MSEELIPEEERRELESTVEDVAFRTGARVDASESLRSSGRSR